jgi:ArsR family transcriptional regulator
MSEPAAIDPVFKALADPVRLKILEFLLSADRACCALPGHVCACDIESLVGLAQPTVSHHMKLLQQAGLVTARKSGRWIYYGLAGAAFARMIGYLQPFADAAPATGSRAA